MTPPFVLLDIVVALTLGPVGPPPLAAHLTDRPDFAGTWILDVTESDFGRSPPADSGTVTITRADSRLILARSTYGAMGHRGQVGFDLPMDGTTHDVPGVGPASAKWSDDALVLTIVGESNVGAMEITEYMTVEGDVMRIERTIMIPGVPGLTQSLVLRRQS